MPADKRAFKNALYQQFARIGKSLSSPHRIEMMELLAQGERTVESLAEELGLTMGNASAHLQVSGTAQGPGGGRLLSGSLLRLRRPGRGRIERKASQGAPAESGLSRVEERRTGRGSS
jgi:DNA-binding transcriptional ArsR family regulator